jgi:uncharacterized membrane protein
MSKLVAITFAGADDAAAALGSVRLLEQEGQIGLEDTAVVSKDADGKVHVKNEVSSGTETGAVIGAVLGSLLWVVFPVGALIGGAVLGGLIGRAAAPGVDGGFVKEVEASLPPGGSALFLLMKAGDPDLLIAAMRRYEGTVLQTALDEEQEAALREALK